jgi:hypothetical protein
MKKFYGHSSYRFCQSFARVLGIYPFTVYSPASRLSILGDNGPFDDIPVDSAAINCFNLACQVFSENSI